MKNNDDITMIAMEVEVPEELYRAMTEYVDRSKKSFSEVYQEAITLWLNTRNLTAVIATLQDQFKL